VKENTKLVENKFSAMQQHRDVSAECRFDVHGGSIAMWTIPREENGAGITVNMGLPKLMLELQMKQTMYSILSKYNLSAILRYDVRHKNLQ
jgi:hypothetical protein